MDQQHREGHCEYCDKKLGGQWGGRGEYAYIKCTCLEQVFATVREYKSQHSLGGLIDAIKSLGLEDAFRHRQPIKYKEGDKEKIIAYIQGRVAGADLPYIL